MASGSEYLGQWCPGNISKARSRSEPGNAGGTRDVSSGVSAGERECKRPALAPPLVFGRIGIRIILCALLIRVAAAPVGVG